METDLGTPIFDRPGTPPMPEHEPPPPPPPQHWDHMQYYAPPPPPPPPQVKKDFFADMDRTTYIMIFIAFILGFFMGRGMIQPILFKSSP